MTKHSDHATTRRLAAVVWSASLGDGRSWVRKTPTTAVIYSLMTLLCHRWVDELRWSLIVLVSQTQLECCLKRIHAACASAETRTSHRIYLP